MKYRRLSESMTSEELEFIFNMVMPNANFTGYQRDYEDNVISIYYIFKAEKGQLDLLADEVHKMPGEESLNGDIEWEYQRYMVANGYSELWLNNTYQNIK